MSEQEKKLAVHESEIADIKKYVQDIKDVQREILNSYHAHELDSVKYKALVDEIVKEKESKRLARQAMTDKLITSSIWGVLVLVVTLMYHGIKAKLMVT